MWNNAELLVCQLYSIESYSWKISHRLTRVNELHWCGLSIFKWFTSIYDYPFQNIHLNVYFTVCNNNVLKKALRLMTLVTFVGILSTFRWWIWTRYCNITCHNITFNVRNFQRKQYNWMFPYKSYMSNSIKCMICSI